MDSRRVIRESDVWHNHRLLYINPLKLISPEHYAKTTPFIISDHIYDLDYSWALENIYTEYI